VPDDFRGKSVKCKQCGTKFTVPEHQPSSTRPNEPATGAGKLTVSAPAEHESCSEKPKKLLNTRSDVMSKETTSRASSSRKKRRLVGLLVIFGSLGLATALLSVGVYFVSSYVKKATENLDSQTVFHGPTKAGEGTGRQPSNLDDALKLLNGGKHSDRPLALRWLAKQPVDLKRRAEVARALDSHLSDGDPDIVRSCLEALKIWADRESVPALLPVLESGDPPVRLLALEVAAILKDQRTIGPVANSLRYVPNVVPPGQLIDAAPIHSAARKTLSAIGKPAEVVVARFHILSEGDDWARDMLTD
jgi:hypothetical protein